MSLSDQLATWAQELGVKLQGVSAREIPGRGIGIVAERDLEDGERLIEIPTAALLTALTVSQTVQDAAIPGVNGVLAAQLALRDPEDSMKPWRRSLPDIESFRKSLPIMWPIPLQELLPQGTKAVLEKQRARFEPDCTAVSAFLPSISYEQYLYWWLVVSTRTFFWTSSDPDVEIPDDPYDCLAIVPFADYFNHAEEGCKVEYSGSGFEVFAHQRIVKGEEIFISYGNHTNDFLLAEYGFVLDENEHDTVCLDEVLLPLFSGSVEKDVRAANFWEEFLLDQNGVCYRTQVALRRLCMPRNKWKRTLARGVDESDEHRAEVNSMLTESLKKYLRTTELRLKDIKGLDCGLDEQKALLRKRWEQIKSLLDAAIERYSN